MNIYIVVSIAALVVAGIVLFVKARKNKQTDPAPAPAPAPAPDPAPAPAPSPAPAPKYQSPAVTYPNAAALTDALTAMKFDSAVYLDGKEVWPGFGPALNYRTLPDGSVTR